MSSDTPTPTFTGPDLPNAIRCLRSHIIGVIQLFALAPIAAAADWPAFGRDHTRNAVSPEADPPTDWDVETGRNIKWSSELGATAFGAPVIADGLVWIGGTQSQLGRSARGSAALLMCLDEQTGELLYEYVSQRLPGMSRSDPDWHGMSSSPLIEGDRLWFVTNRCETVCLDIAPLKQEPRGEPNIVWMVDMRRQFGVHVRPPFMGPGFACSIAPSLDGLIFVTTSNGVDESYRKIAAPDAPGLIGFNKETGEVRWTKPTTELALHGDFPSPLVGHVAGRDQVIVPRGDGWLRSYDPHTGELLWEFDINPKQSVFSSSGRSDRNYFLAPPVLYEDRIYIASGQERENGDGPGGRLVCLDPSGTGDISSELAVDRNSNELPRRRIQAVDPDVGERAIPNPNSGLVWEFTSVGDHYEEKMHRTTGGVVIRNGLLIAPDFGGAVHCLDARTGATHWHWDTFEQINTPPLLVDDKVYFCTDDDRVLIFEFSPDPDVAIKQPDGPQAQVDMHAPMYVAPIFANGVLYITTRSRLYAIQQTRPDNN